MRQPPFLLTAEFIFMTIDDLGHEHLAADVGVKPIDREGGCHDRLCVVV